DWYYDAGFDEASGNAQTSNYGRGGIENDNIHAEAQDFGDLSNANMSTPADGAHPRMQMYVFPTPGRPQFTINSPASIAGPRLVGIGGPRPDAVNVTAEVVPVSQGTFGVTSTSTMACGAGPEYVTSADVNADGKRDLLSANNSGSVSVWLGNGSGGFGARSDFA